MLVTEQQLWDAVDINKDGHLNYLEFCSAFQVCLAPSTLSLSHSISLSHTHTQHTHTHTHTHTRTHANTLTLSLTHTQQPRVLLRLPGIIPILV